MLCLFLSSIKSKEIAHKLMGLAGPTSCLLGLMSSWLALVPAPAPAPARPPPRRPFHFKATSRAPSISSGGVSRGCNTTVRSLPQPHRRRSFMEAQSQPPPVAAVAVRRDATTGLAFLLFVLSVVMISFLSLAMISFPTWRALQQLDIAVHKLSKVVAEEVPGTLSSLKLSILEINDLTSQLKNFRQKLSINRFGKKNRGPKQSKSNL
ncbi:hypothetical protein GUJ93_ZPchr0005g15764 [Zizania palustris]|nr:hypothetical protein GUJ93_ZPchr0005g15764 [Zizania palustris]KAG8067096.1 hypothetical protein GUJ93_ZPchr0005g15764 [Zizania palustris]